MGKSKDLKEEKGRIVQLLSNGLSSLEIAKEMHRDNRTIKKFINNPLKQRTYTEKFKFRKICRREVTLIKQSLARNQLSSSKIIFDDARVDVRARNTRCRILNSIGNVRCARKRPPLSKQNIAKRMTWAKENLKTNFSNVLFTDECRATLDGPDGFSRGWMMNNTPAPIQLKRQQGGGGVMFWAGIHCNNLIGPFRVNDGVKMNSDNYQSLLTRHFLPYYRHLPAHIRNKLIFMQDNAPSHSSHSTLNFLRQHGFSGQRYMSWPPSSPDINPIENYWAVFKRKLYEGGQQFSNKDELWSAILATFRSMDKGLIKTLTNSMDNRLISVLQHKGRHINY